MNSGTHARRLALATAAALGTLAGTAQAATPINTQGGTSGLWGGTEIFIGDWGTCTTGFAIQNGGGKFMVTAGHCANAGTRVRAVRAGGVIQGELGQLIGVNNGGTGNDFAAYGNGAVRGFQNASGFQMKVTGWVAPAGAQGGRACYNGATTGYTCGVIAGVFGDRFCLAGAPNPAIAGDSGSAVYTEPSNGEVRIIGIINDAASCGTSVTRILDAYQASLVTECSL